MRVKVTERSALVEVAASTQQLRSHAGLVLVRELWDRLGVAELVEAVTVKKRERGYSPAQAILGLCETLIAGGECLDDGALLRGDSAQATLRGHSVPEATTLGRFLRRFTLGQIGQLNGALEGLFARVRPLLEREQLTLDLDATVCRASRSGRLAAGDAWHLCGQGRLASLALLRRRDGRVAACEAA